MTNSPLGPNGKVHANKTLGSLIVPLHNEEDSINKFLVEIRKIQNQQNDVTFEIIFVNDGSSDSTILKLLGYQEVHPEIVIVDLSRNFGKEAALTAGFLEAKGDFMIPMDVDLQDPPSLIPDMIKKWREGFEVIEARRTDRTSDSYLKRKLARAYYAIHNSVADVKISDNVGDFRLMDRKVVNAIMTLPESQRFMKGLFAWVGFRTSSVDYVRGVRSAGQTKFSYSKLLSLAIEGLTSFSLSPLRIWTYVGLVVSIFSLSWAGYVVTRSIFLGIEAPGYASTIAAVTILGGLQLIGIGVLGEYLGRTYIEAKRRPPFIVRDVHRSS